MRRLLLALVGALTGALPGCVAAPAALPEPASAFRLHPLPGADGVVLQALLRSERAAPLRYRVIVLPGSGCAGLGAFAERYFAGLLHAQVLVLHKPGVAPQARTAAADCAPDLVRQDRLSVWQAHARSALRADALQRQGQPALPQLLVGISEGAELLPALAPEVPHLAGLVLLSASGLDPQEAGRLQARRLGLEAQWLALPALLDPAQAGALPDSALLQGRSLGYWRDLWHWPVAQPLTAGPWPLLQVWGADDALVPAAAYQRFARRARQRSAAWCTRRLDGADHGLQHRATGADGVQQLWAWIEQWARAPQAGLCAPLSGLTDQTDQGQADQDQAGPADSAD
ncbi:alpha/beta hydrolase [Verminephrobacter sp. Larva24]|uniref:alpha/beta hydrolase n=1 Tax=Verminephrobacter eiseniae TaxID=364317 RepID=UPI0010D285C7|nr:alpha/beta hydrolase [Verminephrobacter eiseniae]KAB7594524.1 alpha/beta hydrolase [Verminephrobacter sp. Larva24]MCW5261598.1 alpha/beta hydrolase [Verminephrobacter eiseniae]